MARGAINSHSPAMVMVFIYRSVVAAVVVIVTLHLVCVWFPPWVWRCRMGPLCFLAADGVRGA